MSLVVYLECVEGWLLEGFLISSCSRVVFDL